MRRAIGTLLRRLGTVFLFLLVALSFAPTVIPPFLDRIYHQGPPSDHFDGERFFNPQAAAPQSGRTRRNFFSRWANSGERAQWPDDVPVRATVPRRRVEGEAMRVTWIGHSTVLVQTQGLNILTDPIWSERASPFAFAGPRRVRAPGVRFEDLPPIDLVLVSHNHYDHLDLPTLRRLWQRDRPTIVTSLGNDTILRNAGIQAFAYDWGEQFVKLSNGGIAATGGDQGEEAEMCAADWFACGRRYGVIVEPVHHWGSRWITDRNRALWSGFTVRLPGGNIFFAGDTGWGNGAWARAAARHGPFRLLLLPIGAYEPRDFMRTCPITPDEAVPGFGAFD